MINMLEKTLTGIFALVCFASCFAGQTPAQSSSPPVDLLDGYKYQERDTLGVISATGIIYRENGLLIEFEEGMNTCCAADPANMARYAWLRRQKINGFEVYVGLIKRGLKTGREPDRPRSKEFGNILVVSYQLGGQKANGINFVAEILSDEELADALLMTLTYNPNR